MYFIRNNTLVKEDKIKSIFSCPHDFQITQNYNHLNDSFQYGVIFKGWNSLNGQ